MRHVLRSTVSLLDRGDLDEALALCSRDLTANTFVAARLHAGGLQSRAAGELWGYYDGGELRSLCWAGANLVPVEATPDAIEAFAARARRQGRHCSSLVGPSETVLDLWSRLEPFWGPARDVRGDQPLMALDGPPLVAPDPAVRRGRPEELPLIVPACVAMFTEEVGYSPVAADGGALYRAQVTGLVSAGRSFVRMDAGPDGPEVTFKAELGSVTPASVQVQGVWVAPASRGRGLAAPGMAAVVNQVRAGVAPLVTLYVNGYNARAVRAYERVGFTRAGTFATVLF
ncbi:MAG: family N-acetyltransferase [Actinomycetota bacterium]|nr:family N-acetyltransferase [Actinomycetota bacterium]